MKISKSLLQAIAVAVVINTASSCTKDNNIFFKDDGLFKKKVENCDPCPACGMG